MKVLGGFMKTLYFGGDIITMVQEGDMPEVLVEENGKIIYVGSLLEGENICKKDGKRVDLEGKTLMPAFIDPHSHFSQVAQSIMMCDLSETKNFDEIAEELQKYQEKYKIGTEGVILGTGYDHNFLEEKAHPDKAVLDQVSDTIPIYISHASGHMGVANSALFKLAEIGDDRSDPEGGKFGRYPDGSMSGYIEETPALMQVLMVLMPRLQGQDMARQIELAQQLYLKYGVTTVQEGAAMGETMQMLTQYASVKKMDVDVVVYPMAEDYEKTVQNFAEYYPDYKDGVKIGGAKIILDGSPQGKSAWLSKPYEGEAEYRGYPTHKNEYVDEMVLKSVEGGYQILAHCNGDAASEQFLTSFEKAYKKAGNGQKDLRPVMIHCQTVREDQLDRMKEVHMIPSIFIGHTYYWGDIHLKNLGEKRGSYISPVKDALERKMIYNFHQDAPVTKPDMLHSVWCAVNRITRKGMPIGQEQCVGVYDALKGITCNAAYEYWEEDQKGTLEVGKKANLVILDSNPLKVPKMEIKDIKVVQTIKEGKIVYNRQ